MKKLLFVPMVIAITMPSVFAFSDIKNSDFENYINNMSTEKLISGYDDGTFRPNNNVSFIESLKIAINASDNFSKIIQDSENWWTPYIDFYRNNFLQNTKSFANNDKISRDFAIYLTLRNLDIILTPENTKDLPTFPDVTTNNFFAPYITFAKYAEITSGYANGNFGPNNMVSRGEFTKMIWKTLREDRAAILAKYQELKKSESTQSQNNHTVNPGVNGVNDNIEQKLIQDARNWLSTNNGRYTRSELLPAARNSFGENSGVYTKIVGLINGQFGGFNYTYKVESSGTVNTGNTSGTIIGGNHSFNKNTTAADIGREVKARLGTNENDASSLAQSTGITNDLLSVSRSLNGMMNQGRSRDKILEYFKQNRPGHYNYAVTYLNNSGYQQ